MNAQTIAHVAELTKDPAFMAEMKDTFFEAVMRLFSNEGLPSGTPSEIPGYTIHTTVSEPWKVIFTGQSTPSGLGCSVTIHILYSEIPVWVMHTLGRYREESLPCLVEALREAYTKKEFIGGRGPVRDDHREWISYGNFAYRNHPGPADFGEFHGREEISTGWGPSNEHCGGCYYHGGLLVYALR